MVEGTPREGRPESLRRVFLSLDQLVVFGAGIVTAVATDAPLLAALGLCGYAVLAVARYRDRREADRRARKEQLEAGLAPLEVDALGEKARRLARDGHKSAEAALHEIACSSDFIRRLFEPAVASVRELHAKQVGLARRLDELERHLRTGDAGRILREAEDLARRIRSCDDPAAREQYERAYRALEATLSSMTELERDAKRIEAQLTAIRASFEAARAKVVQAKSHEARGSAVPEVASGEVSGPLESLANEVDALSGAVDEVFVRARRAPLPPLGGEGARGRDKRIGEKG